MAHPLLKQKSQNEAGFSLTSLLIGLALTAILMVVIALTIEGYLQDSTSTTQVTTLNARAARINHLLSNLIHNSGFGFPLVSSCPAQTLIGSLGGVVGVNRPINADLETATEYGSNLPADFDSLTISSGNAASGSAVMGRIQSLPSTSSSVVKIAGNNTLALGNSFVVEIPGKACLMAFNTGISGNSGNFYNLHYSPEFNDNPSNGISSLLSYMSAQNIGNANLSPQDFVNARILFTGPVQRTTIFVQQNQLIGDYINSTANGAESTQTVIANGVLGLKISLGTGSAGTIQQWLTVQQWQALNENSRPAVLAVRIDYILASLAPVANAITPATLSLMGSTFTVPSNEKDHLIKVYHLTVPVENEIWAG